MSAAEKLKALDTLTLKNEHGVPIRSLTVAEQLVDALPQIVAVVEAAKIAVTLSETAQIGWGDAIPRDVRNGMGRIVRDGRAALAALDEALS